MTSTTKHSGRPPTGIHGKRSSDYSVVHLRLPPALKERLKAATRARGLPMWRVASDVLHHALPGLTADAST